MDGEGVDPLKKGPFSLNPLIIKEKSLRKIVSTKTFDPECYFSLFCFLNYFFIFHFFLVSIVQQLIVLMLNPSRTVNVSSFRNLIKEVLIHQLKFGSKLVNIGFALLEKLVQQSNDFFCEYKWNVKTWIPLVSKYLPRDTITIYKKESCVRIDTRNLLIFRKLEDFLKNSPKIR